MRFFESKLNPFWSIHFQVSRMAWIIKSFLYETVIKEEKNTWKFKLYLVAGKSWFEKIELFTFLLYLLFWCVCVCVGLRLGSCEIHVHFLYFSFVLFSWHNLGTDYLHAYACFIVLFISYWSLQLAGLLVIFLSFFWPWISCVFSFAFVHNGCIFPLYFIF